MQNTLRSLAKRLTPPCCLALLIAGCGGGNGGNGTNGPLDAEGAVEASIGVALATGKALPAVFLDVDLELQPLTNGTPAALSRVRNGAAQGSTFACAGGGSSRVACAVDARGETRLDIEYDRCRDGADPLRRRDGSLSVRALDPDLCLTGDLRNDLPFAVELSGYSSVATDAHGAEIARLEADLTESVNPEPGGCFTLDGTRSVSGTLHVHGPGSGVDLSITARDLTFEIASTGSPCQQRIAANGGFDIDDRGAGQRFTQTFDEAVFAFSSDGGLVALSISGTVSNSCIGEVDFSSDEPLRIDPAAACPLGGALSLGFADGGAGAVRFTGAGGAEIDFGADGTVEESVASCVDASLARCRR